MKCNHCNQEVPNDSLFCPFCGQTVAKRIEEEKNAKTKGITLSAVVICFFIIAVVGEYIYFSNQIVLGNDLLSKEYEANVELSKQLEESDKKIKQLEKQKLTSQKVANTLGTLESFISYSSNTNGIIKTDSVIYSMRPLETIKIDVKWLNNTSIYMGGYDRSVINCNWVGDDLEVTGEKYGVTKIIFGSNANFTKDKMQITIFCY